MAPDPRHGNAGGPVPGKLAQGIVAVGDLRHSVSGLKVATYKRPCSPLGRALSVRVTYGSVATYSAASELTLVPLGLAVNSKPGRVAVFEGKGERGKGERGTREGFV